MATGNFTGHGRRRTAARKIAEGAVRGAECGLWQLLVAGPC